MSIEPSCNNFVNWRPTATLDTLKERADILWTIHQFFRARKVLFVETPILSRATTTDLHLTPFVCRPYTKKQTQNYFLCTSPEFPMKRLLCAHHASIYQITKSFRAGDSGIFHNPEFSLLEWYRINFTTDDLMQETIDLLSACYKKSFSWSKETYQNIFKEYLKIDPLIISTNDLKLLSLEKGLCKPKSSKFVREDYLNFLFSSQIEKHLGKKNPIFITHFPKEQALLAANDPHNDTLALRFELYHDGTELANGFFELQDPSILKERLFHDSQLIESHNLLKRPIDLALIASQECGLPRCCGIALGIDRLCMQILNKKSINEVISFSYDIA